jgi:hypothetical protein
MGFMASPLVPLKLFLNVKANVINCKEINTKCNNIFLSDVAQCEL